ncbi:MAG TPA: hypothetical protein QF353_02095 [Gammaproteobacteria bacterium]|nr:hypothetical protein [Gammaproteobacteria bacterium]
MYHLGLMYKKGKGQPGNKPNFKEAIKWYKKTLDAGYEPLFHQPYAGDKLTCDGMKGGVQSVCKKAITGDAEAMTEMGSMYWSGEDQPGSKPNYKKAMKWYKKAADAGDEDAKGKVVKIQKLIQ